MEQKLDPENLGIVTIFTFMDEFFPCETNSTPDVFTLWHYNGLSLGSNSKVLFFQIFYALYFPFSCYSF
jgi:hypothetical protein